MRTEAHDSVGHGGAEAGGLQRRSSSSIGLVWGVGKQRAGTLYKPGRTKETTRRHLRRGWNGGKGKGGQRFMPCDVHGCWKTAMRELGLWIEQSVQYKPGDHNTGL